MEISAANLTSLFTGFDVVFQRGFEKPPSYYEQITSVVRSASRQTTYPWLGRTTKFRQWLGDRVIQALETHEYTIVNRNFEDTVAIDRNDIEDDTYGANEPINDRDGKHRRAGGLTMPAGAITLADITAVDWSLALGAIGEVVQGIADVEQCLGIIVTTPRGSDPLRPTFGADIWRYIDFPINRALPAIVSELTSAITIWEPRVNLLSVTAQPVNDASAQTGAHLDVTLNWQLKLGMTAAPVQSTIVTIPGATV